MVCQVHVGSAAQRQRLQVSRNGLYDAASDANRLQIQGMTMNLSSAAQRQHIRMAAECECSIGTWDGLYNAAGDTNCLQEVAWQVVASSR